MLKPGYLINQEGPKMVLNGLKLVVWSLLLRYGDLKSKNELVRIEV
jgi:hypothetical protein